jgi:hypothetical protein
MESLVSDIPAGDGNIEKLFLRCRAVGWVEDKTLHESLLVEAALQAVTISYSCIGQNSSLYFNVRISVDRSLDRSGDDGVKIMTNKVAL